MLRVGEAALSWTALCLKEQPCPWLQKLKTGSLFSAKAVLLFLDPQEQSFRRLQEAPELSISEVTQRNLFPNQEGWFPQRKGRTTEVP